MQSTSNLTRFWLLHSLQLPNTYAKKVDPMLITKSLPIFNSLHGIILTPSLDKFGRNVERKDIPQET